MKKKSCLIFILLICNLFIYCMSVSAQTNPFNSESQIINLNSAQASNTANPSLLAIDKAWVNVRSGPSTNYKILDCLPQGQQGFLIGEENGWYKINFGKGLVGYVRADLVADVTPQPIEQISTTSIAQWNNSQFDRWDRHLGNDLFNYSKFPWYWRLNRAQTAFDKGNYQKAYDLAVKASGNPIEAAYMQAKCLNALGKHLEANKILKSMEKYLEDRVFNQKITQLAQPYINEPIVFKFGGYDDISEYKAKKSSGNRLGLNSSEYYEKYVDINTWQWRSAQAHKEFNSIGGIDCSGFVQIIQKEAFKEAGVKFPIASRVSTQGLAAPGHTTEINPGHRPPPPPDIRPGDMILLDYGHNRFGHSMIFQGLDAHGNIVVLQMGDTAEINILSPEKFQYYKGTYRANGMDEVRKALTA